MGLEVIMAYTLTDEDKKMAMQMANQQFAQSQAASAQPKKSAGMLGTVLSTIGGIGGGILGLPFGGVGAIGGGAVGSGLGRGLANILTGADAGDGVIEDTVMGGVGGALGKVMKVGKVGLDAAKGGTAAAAVGAAPKTGILSRFGGALEKTGNKVMASQANLTRPTANKLSEPVADTFGKLQSRTGVGNIDDLTEIGKGVTGRDGLVAIGVEDSVSTAGVKLDGLRRAAEDSLMNRGIPLNSPKAKEILENVKNQFVKANGGANGSLADVVGGKQALQADRFFAENASVAKQGFKRSGDVATKQSGQVYNDLSQFVKERLYNAPGTGANFVTKGGGKDQIVQSLRAMAADDVTTVNPKVRAAYAKLADEFDTKVKSIADARTFQKDFVQLTKIAEKTAEASQGAATQLGGTMQGAGKFIQQPLNILATPLEAQSGKIGSKMADWGRKLQGTGAPKTAAAAADGPVSMFSRKDLIKSMVAQGVPRAAMQAGFAGANPNDQVSPEALAMMNADPSQFTPEQLSAAGLSGAPTDPSAAEVAPGGMTKESLDKALFEAAQAGDDKNVAMLIKLSDHYFPQGSAQLSAGAQKSMMATSNALGSVQQLEELLAKNGGQDNGVLANVFGGAAGIAGKLGANDNARLYNDKAGSLVTPLARAISGETGTLSDQDIKRAQLMLPQLTDSTAVRKQKIASIYQAIQTAQQSAQQYGGGGQPDLSAMFGGM